MLEPWQTHDEAIAILDKIIVRMRLWAIPIDRFENELVQMLSLMMGLASGDSEVRLVEAYSTILFEKRHKCESYRKFWEESARGVDNDRQATIVKRSIHLY